MRRRGWRLNPKRVYRLLGEDNLLCLRKRRFVVTTDSKQGRKIYPNLPRDLVPTGVDQLWRADITYSRPREEFVYQAVVLDAFSRRVIGWALDRTMEEELTLTALHMAVVLLIIWRTSALIMWHTRACGRALRHSASISRHRSTAI